MLFADKGGTALRYNGSAAPNLTGRTVSAEVAALNADEQLPHNIDVIVESCKEPNAFFDPERRKIKVCAEFEGHFRDIKRSGSY